MTQFFTVKEAAQDTGKSPSSIRRIIYPILETPDHPDRQHIQPTIDEVQQFRIKGENFAWRISEELLRREVPPADPLGKGSDKPTIHGLHDGYEELLAMLRRELDTKNQQITQQAQMLATQMELINSLSERVRESNVLVGSLHQQLVLADASPRPKSKPIDAEARNSTAEKNAPKATTKSPPKPQKSKRGFLGRFFR